MDFFEKGFAVLPEISPEETMMIGDSLTADIAGGRQMGMKTCWYDREQTGPSSGSGFYHSEFEAAKRDFIRGETT